MNFVYVAIIVWLIASFIMPRRTAAADTDDLPRMSIAPAPLAAICATLVALFALNIAVTYHAATLYPYGPARGAAPLLLLDDRGAGDAPTSNAELVISLAETVCLFLLYRVMRRGRLSRVAVAILSTGFAALATLAVASPVANSSDLYGYVGYALQPATAYAPTNLPFGGDHAPLNVLFGSPRPAAWYGPLWIGVTHVLLLPFTHLATQLQILRLLEVAALGVVLVGFARAKASAAVLAVLAMNPAIFGLWILDGHNDLFGITFVVIALACRHPALRVALVAAAGLVKLPLVLVGGIVFAGERSVLHRVGLAVAAIGACLGLSFLFGGPTYLGHLAGVSGIRHDPTERLLHALAAGATIAMLGAALVLGRYRIGASWLWRTFAAFPAPWYAVWGLPYALASGAAALVLVTEPIEAYLTSWNYATTPAEYTLKFIVLIAPVAYALRMRIVATRTHEDAPRRRTTDNRFMSTSPSSPRAAR